MNLSPDLFPKSYEDSRDRFRRYLDPIRQLWPSTQLNQRTLYQTKDLTIDWIESKAATEKKQVLMFSLGEHGIEGYVGSAMLDLFVQEFLPGLNPKNTGLVLIHAINPWGMKHYRRVNQENVDLNRNFVWNGQEFTSAVNPDYARINSLLNPKKPATSKTAMQISFLAGFLKSVGMLGARKFRQATLLGQYRYPKGIYYGGSGLQEETSLVMGLYREAVEQYDRILLLDMHTGYGPRSQMSVVNSVQETRDSAELERIFGIPNVVKTNPDEFYSIRGDMIEFIYTLVRKQAPGKHLYATSFEFGTYGDSLGAALRSLETMIFENRLTWFGTKNEALRTQIQHDMLELFHPQDARWQASAVENARAAFRGILRAEGYLSAG